MKNALTLWRNLLPLVVAASLSTLLTFSACKSGEDPQPEPTQAEIVTGILTKSKWPLTSVTVEGENAIDLFKDFSITFSATGYTTSGTTPVWARTGTWTFVDATTANKFKREDNVEVTIESISESQLKLTLTWDKTTYAGGRSNSLKGKHEFVLSK